MLILALRLALIALWYPVMLIVVFLLWHAIHCTLNASWR